MMLIPKELFYHEIYATDIAQYWFTQKFLSDNNIEFFSVQPRRERPRKTLLQGIPKSFTILKVKIEFEWLQFDTHRVSQFHNFRTKEPYPYFLIDITPTGNYKELYDLDYFLGVIKAVTYRSKEPKQCYNCQKFSHSSVTYNFLPYCN